MGKLGTVAATLFSAAIPGRGTKATAVPKTRQLNPFKGKTPLEIDARFQDKAFQPRGPDPGGRGGYVNPRTGRSYHIDLGSAYARGLELPHVDGNRNKPNPGNLPKRKFPLK